MVMVELVYVAANKSLIHIPLELEQGATVYDALFVSGIYTLYPETKSLSVGIFSRQVSLEHVLKEGDRIELYRPLVIDPKEKRRQKANSVRKK